MKKIVKYCLAGLLLSFGLSSNSYAVLLLDGTDVGVEDILLTTTDALANSGEATETAWVDDYLTNTLLLDTTSLTYDYKIESATVVATDTTDVFAIDLTPTDPTLTLVADYFIIKNTTTWALFDNEIMMDWAVVDVSDPLLVDMKIPNDWEVSHVTVFSNTSAVPEPTSLALMALGLLGLGFSRRRS